MGLYNIFIAQLSTLFVMGCMSQRKGKLLLSIFNLHLKLLSLPVKLKSPWLLKEG